MNRTIAVGLALIVATLLLGLAATHGWTLAFDTDVLRHAALVHGRSSERLITATQRVSDLGLPGARTAVLAVFAIALFATRSARAAAIYLVAVVASIAGYTALKLLFERARPALVPWLDQPHNPSFPSGHAAGATVVVLLAAMLSGRPGALFLAATLSIAIGVTRPMLGVHWPTDVIGGWLWGTGSALIGYALVQRGAMRIAPSRRTSSPLK